MASEGEMAYDQSYEEQPMFDNHDNATLHPNVQNGESTMDKPVSIFDLEVKPPPGFMARNPT